MKIVSRVVVSCVTTEVVKVVDPAVSIRADRIHLLNYVKRSREGNPSEMARERLYDTVYEENVKRLKEADIEIVEHRDVRPYKFDECFHAIYDILTEEKRTGSALYVNVSAGSPEYAAAASIASMMIDGVSLFSVGAKASSYTVPFDKQLDLLTHDGEIVGTAFEVYEPIGIDPFPLPTPDVESLKAMKVFASIPEATRSNVNVIRELMRRGMWRFSQEDGLKGTTLEMEESGEHRTRLEEYKKRQRKEAVLYQRGYIDVWKKQQGWIEKSRAHPKRYCLTDKGKRYVNIFCSDAVFKL